MTYLLTRPKKEWNMDKLEEIRNLAIEWLSHSNSELYGRQIMYILGEPTLWKLFEDEENQ